MFELLAPVFAVAGGLLAGVPLILHMFRRTPALRMPFSVVRFLIPTLPTTTKRASIEHWPLMLLRILALVLIGLAFARPFQRVTIAKAAESGSADRIAVLMDASASMRRDGIRESALKVLDNVVASVKDEDTLSISVFSESTRSLLTSAEWRQTEPANRSALVARVREAYDADWLSTQTATAMLATADEVAREEGAAGLDGERRVVLITDFQEGSQLDGLRAGTWPDSVKLDLRIVSPTESGNAGMSLVEESRTGKLRVRVSNSGDAAVTKLQLSPFDSQGAPVGSPITVDVGGGQRRTVSVPESVDGQPRIVGYELLNEPHVFDNVVDLPLEDQQAIQVAHAGSSDPNNADEMRYYLQRVLDGSETDPIEVVDLVGADGVAIPVPSNIRLVFVTDVVSEPLAASLRTFVDNGGVLVIALKSVEMCNSLKNFLPDDTTIEETAVDDYVMLGRLDFSSPLLTPFADARFADFSSIRFWHYRKLSFDEKRPDAPRVIGRFDSGSPAILQSAGTQNARVYVLTAGWHPYDSQWALSTRFPPMILRLVQIANPRQSGYRLFEAGQRIYPQVLTNAERWAVTRPDGSVQNVTAEASADQNPTLEKEASSSPAAVGSVPAAVDSVVLNTPGRWMLNWETPDGPKVMSLLVTVPAAESRTEPLPLGQLQALGMSAEIATTKAGADNKPDAANTSQLDARELESQQKLWRWLLVAGLACLALEELLAFFIERRNSVELS